MYIDTNTNTYPLYPGDVLLVSPSWSLGDPLPTGWFSVEPTDLPTISETQTYYEGAPIIVDGIYTQVWLTRDLTQSELEFRAAPFTAREKLRTVVGLTDAEIEALVRGLK
jgi:hypothetical protein